MKLAECDLDQADAVVALWERCQLTRPWNDPHADLRQALLAPDATVLVGSIDDTVVASAMVGFDGHRGWIYYLAVEPSLQRRGYGRAIVAAAEDWLRDRDAPKLNLMVREENAEAIRFYGQLGLERLQVAVCAKWLR